MNKLLCGLLLGMISYVTLQAQPNQLLLKKKERILHRYYPGESIAFQLKNAEWRKGIIRRITSDSFFIRAEIVRYHTLGSDTVHFPETGYALTDVARMPKEAYLIDYKNGRFQISGSGGHVHWYWIKSGWLFRAGAAGYTGLYLINSLLKQDFSWRQSRFEWAAAVFAFGYILKKTYRTTYPMNGKFKLVAAV